METVIATLKSNADGYVLLVTLYLLLMLTIIGIAATHTANVEVQISGNNRRMVEDFYISEGALITVLENGGWWLGEGFLNSGEDAANWSGHVDFDGDGTNDVFMEIRCVAPTKVNIASLSQAANDVPIDQHVAPSPANSGYSARHFNIRKYAVTATNLRSGINLQVGAWKVFGKY